ncbi:Putative Zn-finger protein [Phaffia rhodozyma]|uniref:Putative Zn-finger protein n=1 Tax=Phaffia rhodozyma TaxID=264483 RepID=A0A0F7SS02_PHARH|nr:Putative Zn-finger protein [Phaffia rhodozyma]
MGNTPSHPRSAPSASNQNPSSSSASSTNNHHISASSVVSSITSRTIHKNRDRSTSSPPVLTPQQIIETEALIDGGHTVPMGLYQLAPQDFSQPVVKQLILDRKLGPFYTGLDDYEEDAEPEEVLKSLREARAAVETKRMQLKAGDDEAAAAVQAVIPKEGSPSERELRELEWYQGASECPLCFLFYPSNINTSRCCDQPICTECFVQIKRAEATLTHLESEPACCPFCMEPNFGIIYNRPRPRITTSHHQSSLSTISAISTGAGDSSFSMDDGAPSPRREDRMRRKSIGHTNSGVVTTDEIRPDWEAKLDAVKAVAARRANRRIVMRQVGDRLIPVGVTSSRTPIAPLQLGEGDQPQSTNGRRGSRRMTGEMAMVGPDIEEIMMMEAMRLSLLEHEQHQARQATEEQNKNKSSAITPQTPVSREDPQSSSRDVLFTWHLYRFILFARPV